MDQLELWKRGYWDGYHLSRPVQIFRHTVSRRTCSTSSGQVRGGNQQVPLFMRYMTPPQSWPANWSNQGIYCSQSDLSVTILLKKVCSNRNLALKMVLSYFCNDLQTSDPLSVENQPKKCDFGGNGRHFVRNFWFCNKLFFFFFFKSRSE